MVQCSQCGTPLNGSAKPSAHPEPEPANQLPAVTPEELLTQAMQLADEDAYDDAILLTRRAIKLKEDFVAAYAFLGELYERVGEREKAKAAYEKALALDKDYEPAKLGKARLEKAPTSVPRTPAPASEPSSWVWAGHPLPLLAATALIVGLLFAVRMGVPPVPKGEPTVAPPITLAPSPPRTPQAPATVPPLPAAAQAAVKRGIDALNANKYDEAIRWFERALQMAPNNNEARSWLLIARAMKEEVHSRASPTIAARPLGSLLPPPLPSPAPATPTPSGSRGSGAQVLAPPSKASPPPTTSPPQPQTQAAPPSGAGSGWGWQPQWQRQPTTPSVPSTGQYSPRPPAGMFSPAFPSSPAVPSPSAQPPAFAPSSPPSIPPPPPSPEELERQATQKVYEGDFAGAVTLYRALLDRGVGVEREGFIRQQLALALQQLRRYDEAAEEYTRAIAAYQRQIERGINVPAAQRGIEVCQRGLEICRRAR